MPRKTLQQINGLAWIRLDLKKKPVSMKEINNPKKTRTCEKYNAQPTITSGCRDTKGVYFPPGKHEESVTLLGCPYWKPWRPGGQCTLDEEKLEGIQKQTRKCYQYNSESEDLDVGPKKCSNLDNGNNVRYRACDYEWGKWDRTEKVVHVVLEQRTIAIMAPVMVEKTKIMYIRHYNL